MERFAHISKDFRTQTLDEHLRGTAELAAEFAAVFGEGPCGAFIGNTHDIGKAPPSWQNHLKKSSGYDESIAEGECDKGSHTAAGAAYALKNGSGICAGLSKLFRAIIEYLPFDPQTGQVNYSAANPSRIRVAILMNEAANHEWAAIQLGDIWYYYDLSIINTANLAERYRMNGSQLNTEDYGSFAETVWRY